MGTCVSLPPHPCARSLGKAGVAPGVSDNSSQWLGDTRARLAPNEREGQRAKHQEEKVEGQMDYFGQNAPLTKAD